MPTLDLVTRVTHMALARSSDDGLPFSQYTSATAVHTTLLGFAAFFLPRTAILWQPTKQTSTDKPQHEFLNALTASPASTVAWLCLGVALIQVWWGGWVRRWYIASVLQSSNSADASGSASEREGDQRIRRVKLQQQRFKVISFLFAVVDETRVLIVSLAFESGVSGDVGCVRSVSCCPRYSWRTSNKLLNPVSHRARLSF